MPNEWDLGLGTNVDGGWIAPDGTYWPNAGSNTRTPSGTVTPGGVTFAPDKLSLVLSSFLSGLAILKGRPGVPTTLSNEPSQPTIIYQGNQAKAGGGGGDGMALAKVETWLKNNTGVALMGAAAVLLFYMKPPAKK